MLLAKRAIWIRKEKGGEGQERRRRGEWERTGNVYRCSPKKKCHTVFNVSMFNGLYCLTTY